MKDRDICLVTGGCGFIGSHVIEELLVSTDWLIINVDFMGIGSSENYKSKDARVVNYDMDINNNYVEKLFDEMKPKYVIHLAAESHVDRSIESPSDFIHSNINGTCRILECVKKHDCRMVHVSTDEVYGHLEPNEEGFNEHSPLQPRSPYAASKASSDLMVLSYRTTYGIDASITRCCNNYGPRQHEEKLIPTIVRSYMQGKKIPVYGDGLQQREWVHVKTHASAIIEVLLLHGGEDIYHISGCSYNVEDDHKSISNMDLIERITYLLEKEQHEEHDRLGIQHPLDLAMWDAHQYIEHVEDRKAHDYRYELCTHYQDRITKACADQEDMDLKETVHYYVDRYYKSLSSSLGGTSL